MERQAAMRCRFGLPKSGPAWRQRTNYSCRSPPWFWRCSVARTWGSSRSFCNAAQHRLIVRPEIKDVKDLKGNPVGITTFGRRRGVQRIASSESLMRRIVLLRGAQERIALQLLSVRNFPTVFLIFLLFQIAFNFLIEFFQ
jgi:hypothetical protein